jgi:predicted glycosyltransferase
LVKIYIIIIYFSITLDLNTIFFKKEWHSLDASQKIEKIWVAISTPFQANFFTPLIKELSGEFEFLITARNHDNIFSILDSKEIDFIPVGKHGGKEQEGKLQAYAHTIEEMIPIIKEQKPNLLLTERWPEAVRVAFGFDIPAWTIFYDERERHVNQMVFPISNKIFSPRFYTFQELYRHGVTDPDKVVWFYGFHTCYLKDAPIKEENPFKKLGLDSPIVLIRPEPEFASFFPKYQPILEKAVSKLVDDKKHNGNDFEVVVFPRSENQARRYDSEDVTVMRGATVQCPVAFADVVVGAAETMLMEAFTLHKPVVSSVYWNESKPLIELHRYVPKAVEVGKLVNTTTKYLIDPDLQKEYVEKSKLIINNMDNPVKIMINEIRRLAKPVKSQTYKRRSKLEIYMDILEVTSYRPCRLTQIMEIANVSHSELKKTLEWLEKKVLIEEMNSFAGRYIKITQEGLDILTNYKKIKSDIFSE